MSALSILIILAVVFNGTLAGGSLDVALVKLPARKRIGAVAYPRFARGNDLGSGLFVYPLWAILSTLLVFAATILAFAGGAAARLLMLLSASSAASILHFMATSQAAPVMLSIGKTPDDEELLASKLDRFARWHAVRAVFQVLAFLLVLAALAALQACASHLPGAVNVSPRIDSPVLCGVPDFRAIGSLSVKDLRLGDSNAPLESVTLRAIAVPRPGARMPGRSTAAFQGPIRVRQGDHLRVVLVNDLPVGTSIHWHGIDVPNSSDGVAGVTQDAVKPGESHTYDFIAAEPGTFWYHSHQDTANQVPRGLFGALVVDPWNPPAVDRDYTLVYHDAVPPSRRFFPILVKILGSIDRKSVAVNGTTGDLALDAAPGDVVRLRIINATAGEVTAYGIPLHLVPIGAPFAVAAMDGRDLHSPQEIESQVLPVGSGQRYDVVLRMPASGVVRVWDCDLGETVTLGSGESARSHAGDAKPPGLRAFPVFDFTRYGTPVEGSPVVPPAPDLTCTLDLGNHAGFHDGRFGLVHTINGTDYPGIPMIEVRQGQRVKLHITNRTEEYHPMHLHGHSLRVLSRNGRPLQGSPVRLDTLLVAPHEAWDVEFAAGNPGIWMLHCHVLLHAATGMDMMVAYAGVSTPFDAGRASGNIPE